MSNVAPQLRRLDANLRLGEHPLLDAATSHSIIATDLHGIVTFFNAGAEQMLQYPANDMLGLRSPHFLHRQLTPAKEWTYIRNNGTTLDVSVAVTPIQDPDGSTVGFLEIATDITPIKTLQRNKSHFLATLSHEVRTPLSLIIGVVELLGETGLDAGQRKCFEVLKRSGDNLMKLVSDVLDVSRIESGKMSLEIIQFDIHELLERTVDLVIPTATAKGLAVRCDVPAGVRVAGDPFRLQQVLLNLLTNAVKFTAAGEIVLAAAPITGGHPGEFSFSVSDTGIGIAPEHLDHIFEDFKQADSTTARQFGGTGLGLGVCRRLISLMGGTLEVRSVLGQGSTFCFSACFGEAA
jgi:signal transduction histidine kinase